MNRCRSKNGFTLLEILIVLVIVGLISGMSIRGLRSLAKTDLRSSTSRMSGAIRYLFDRASTTGKYHRLVIDVDEGRYWAEVSDDRFYIPREPETEASQKKLAQLQAQNEEKDRRKAEMSAAAGGFDMSKIEAEDFRPKKVRFGAFKETTLKPVRVKNTKIMDVYTPRLAEVVTQGRAYIYFFPLGQTEPAIVHLSDLKGETFYSLVVHPITGRVRIYNEYVKPRFDEQIDDVGNSVP
ncbi:MAG: prepilin-type N-terminal cleavage/methylation domain-containing protein [Deltaproteobacteria bacterium]|nr:prepilin-type N-terminal cleavage/methylation domain-containing protein [Deltaproteobacteria bacterium]